MGSEPAAVAPARPAAVVHVITKLELGGAQENTLYTVGHLDRREFEPYLLAGPGGLLDGEARALLGGRFLTVPHLVREVRPWSDWRAYREIGRVLLDIRRGHPGPMVVHTHSSKAGILGREAARAAGADAVIHSVHGFGFNPRQARPARALFVGIERRAARGTDAFIAVSRANMSEGERLGLFLPGAASLIRSGIVIDDFARPKRPAREVRASLGVPPDAPVALMIACFKPQKAPVDFVRAAALVSAARPDARFLVVGDGELRPAVEAAVRGLGLEGKVLLLGWRRDVPDLLHAADLLALTSLWEGLPRVCPQAMAAGRPVVATAVDGTPEAVEEGKTGFLVPPGDFRGAAERMLRLLNDPALARAMGEEGRRRVAEFDAGLMVRRQEELYRRLLGRGHPAGKP